MTLASDVLRAASADDAVALLQRKGLTDGLPVVVPSRSRVESMLAATGLDPDIILGEVGPGGGAATIEKVAINSVMAGCDPEVFPIVIAAVEAVCDPDFALAAVQATTHATGPIVIVNGPARERCNVHSGVGALGPGHRANATIGRALRLVLLNVGGGAPGVGDMATLGSPAKFSCCMAEAQEASPFEPLHVSRGWGVDESVVTVLAGESPHSVYCNFLEVSDPDTFLRILASGMINAATNNIHVRKGMIGIILNPLHATVMSESGLTRRDMQNRLFELATMTRGELRAIAGAMVDPGDETEVFHVVPQPDDFLVFVGGEEGGAYSAWIPTWGGGARGSVAISRPVRFEEACDVGASTE